VLKRDVKLQLTNR